MTRDPCQLLIVHGQCPQIPKGVILASIPSCQDSATQRNCAYHILLIIRCPPECTCTGVFYGLAMPKSSFTVEIVLRGKCACGDHNRQLTETFHGPEDESHTKSYSSSIYSPKIADVRKHSALQTKRTGFDRKEHKDNADIILVNERAEPSCA